LSFCYGAGLGRSAHISRIETYPGGNAIARTPAPWSSSCSAYECRGNKRKEFTQSGVDQPCAAEQNLALSIRTAMLS
ncbi:MAG: hypothetical protein WBZ25_18255, partial [Pseudolabrys sp.]